MPPLPTVRSASTAEPFAHHVGRTCHQGQNPKNHNRKASACLPIFFLFCLPFVCPFACPFFFHDCKKAFVFNGYNRVFVCPFVCPSVLSQSSWKAMAHNPVISLKSCLLKFVPISLCMSYLFLPLYLSHTACIYDILRKFGGKTVVQYVVFTFQYGAAKNVNINVF